MREEIIDKELLCAKIIKAILTNDDIVIRSDEGNSFVENGLYTLLDTLCKFYHYDGSKITIETNNWLESHNQYHVVPAKYSTDFVYFSNPHDVPNWDHSKIFGMFLGLGRKERIYSLLRYRQSRYKDLGLTSFNQDFMDIDITADIAKVCQYANCKIDDIVSIQPYSDIDEVEQTPIWLNKNTNGKLWENAYRQIAIEIVCETTMYQDAFHVTEKTLRPMYYRRPFLVVGSKDYLKKLQTLGFRTFEGIIPDYYDQLEGFIRVDNVFQILESLIESNAIKLILEQCQSDIEHNYNLVLELSNKHLKIKKENPGYYAHD